MVREDFYTGEPVEEGSPPFLPNDVNEAEAASMASFGKYDYDPGMRSVVSSPVSIYPGRDGYNTGYSMYGNPVPTYGQYRGNMNPVFQPGGYGGSYFNSPYYTPPYYQPPQPQLPTSIHMPGLLETYGEYLPPANYEEQISHLQNEYWRRKEEIDAEKEVERASQQSYFGYNSYGYNYYGMPFYNTYQYNGINNEIAQRAKEMQDEARERRLDFMTNLSRLAHNFNHDNISDEDIRKRYQGQTIEIPQTMIPMYQTGFQQARLESMVPFDNSQAYRDFHNSVSKEFNNIIPINADLKTTFDGMGIVSANWELEEEDHRRRDHTNLYNNSNNAFKHFVRQKAKERYCKEKGLSILPNGQVMNIQQQRQQFMNQSTVLSQNASLSDDGTLNVHLDIPYNVGHHTGEIYSVSNSQETEYQEKRERFARFLDSIPGSIYLDNQKHKKLEGYTDG